MFTHVLSPIDGSACSMQALKVAARLAAEQKANLTICTVVDPAKASAMAFGEPLSAAACMTALDEEARSIAADALNLVKSVATADSVELQGEAVEEIVNYAGAGKCDVIVMGTHGRGGISRALVGSVAEGVLRHANVPVMVIRWTHAHAPAVMNSAASSQRCFSTTKVLGSNRWYPSYANDRR